MGGWNRRPPRDFQRRVTEALAITIELLESLHRKADRIMSDQDTANELAQEIETDVQAEAADLDAIKTEIANLEAANPGVDFTGLKQAVSDLDAGKAAEDAVANPPTS